MINQNETLSAQKIINDSERFVIARCRELNEYFSHHYPEATEKTRNAESTNVSEPLWIIDYPDKNYAFGTKFYSIDGVRFLENFIQLKLSNYKREQYSGVIPWWIIEEDFSTVVAKLRNLYREQYNSDLMDRDPYTQPENPKRRGAVVYLNDFPFTCVDDKGTKWYSESYFSELHGHMASWTRLEQLGQITL